MAVARVESRYRASARNRRTGATGLMQVMPATGRAFRCGSLTDPAANLSCGARILARYRTLMGGRVRYALASYLMGPRSPGRALRAGRPPPGRRFVEKVLAIRDRFRRVGCDG